MTLQEAIEAALDNQSRPEVATMYAQVAIAMCLRVMTVFIGALAAILTVGVVMLFGIAVNIIDLAK